MFNKILIANRGEIAIRIAQSCADLGIESLGIFAEDDHLSLHTKKTDGVVGLKGDGVNAYLDIEQIIKIALQENCDAIHPGYGFLSENAAFSRRCAQERICFIGSSPLVLEQVGDKSSARQLAKHVNVPVVQGLDQASNLNQIQDFYRTIAQAQSDNTEIMIKAIAGGGGRGIRRVTDYAQIEPAYQACKQEARIAFGSEDLYAEQLVSKARHIEVQILGDQTGAISHLWERECTVQRRHQKLIEIAPSPSLTADTRQPIIEAAIKLATKLKYRGLGTFEFLVNANDHSEFFFMEVNPRIQVEHTITEEITGVDLVSTQIRLAAGASLDELGLGENQGLPQNTAIQARLNIESIQEDGSNQTVAGAVSVYQAPSGFGVRVDDCMYSGYRVNPSYDSLAAKVIVNAPTYSGALSKLARSLNELQLEGVVSNKSLLLNVLNLSELKENKLTTQLVSEQLPELLKEVKTTGRHFPQIMEEHDNDQHAILDANLSGLYSPTAGTLRKLEVGVGDFVHSGQTIAVVEAMKMEFLLKADQTGWVEELPLPAGNIVSEHQLIAVLRPTADEKEARSASDEVDLSAIPFSLHELQARQFRLGDSYRKKAVDTRHSRGLRTARENIADLFNDGYFTEYGALAVAAQRSRHSEEKLIDMSPADGVITGIGAVNKELFNDQNARCATVAYDYTVLAGTQGFNGHHKIDRILDKARAWQIPVVLFAEGGGGRPTDTDMDIIAGLHTPSFASMSALSGLVPTVGIASGYCFAGNAALFGVCDVTIATQNASIGLGGPAMIEAGGLGVYKASDVGPVSIQSPNGVVDIVVEDEAEAVAVAKQYLSYFQGDIDDWSCGDQRHLRHAIPENRVHVYNIRELINHLADTGSVLELRKEYAKGVVTALVRIEGTAFGLYANNPSHLGGAIDAAGGNKIARFMQLCDAHDLPMIALCDTPGFMVGPDAETQATVRHVSRIFVTAASITVPFFSVVLRKGYGLGAMGMTAGSFHAPLLNVSWPSGEFGAMSLEGAAQLASKQALAGIEDPVKREEALQDIVDELYARGNAINMASHLEIDAVIDPADTRSTILNALAATPKSEPRKGKKRLCIDTW